MLKKFQEEFHKRVLQITPCKIKYTAVGKNVRDLSVGDGRVMAMQASNNR